MNPAERKLLDKLDKLVIESTGEDLKKIQEIDLLTQMDGTSFYQSYVNSKTLANYSIKQETKDFKK